MLSGQIVTQTPMEALQGSLEEEKAAHRQCQLRMQAVTMELRLSQKKADDLEKRLAEERRSHEYFKSRLASVKARNSAPRAHSESALAEVAALSAEKEAWLAEKQSLLHEQTSLNVKLDRCAKDGETAATCRMALISALAQSQQELEATKNQLAKHQAEVGAVEERVPECTICFEVAASIAFGPCGHVCACTKCSDLHECPLCRAIVSTKMKLHFA